MSAFDIKGKIHSIQDTQSFPSGFTKREFVLETLEEKYPQEIKFECLKDKINLLDDLSKGDEVHVHSVSYTHLTLPTIYSV